MIHHKDIIISLFAFWSCTVLCVYIWLFCTNDPVFLSIILINNTVLLLLSPVAQWDKPTSREKITIFYVLNLKKIKAALSLTEGLNE